MGYHLGGPTYPAALNAKKCRFPVKGEAAFFLCEQHYGTDRVFTALHQKDSSLRHFALLWGFSCC
jgi:hypothetical protein